MPLCAAAADQVERRTAARKLAEQARNAEKVAAAKREEQKKQHAGGLRRCMRSEQIVRFKGSPFSKAGAANSREGIGKEIVFIRPRHDTNQMPDYIAVELLLRRTAVVDTVASSSPPAPSPPHRSNPRPRARENAPMQLPRILKHNATVDKTKTDGSTPLCKAAGNNHTNAMQLLLRRTAAVVTVASSSPPPTPCHPPQKHSGVQRFITSFRSRAVWLGHHFKCIKSKRASGFPCAAPQPLVLRRWEAGIEKPTTCPCSGL